MTNHNDNDDDNDDDDNDDDDNNEKCVPTKRSHLMYPRGTCS